MTRKLTLGEDSSDRKNIPLHSGCYTYFAAALAGVARHSKIGNGKHNPGEPLHHSRGKSSDHADCIARHLMDIADMRARKVVHTEEETAALLTEANALAWRALALSQELHEKFGGAPLAPGARLPAAEPEFKLTPEVGSYTKKCTHLFRGDMSARIHYDGSCSLCGEKNV